MELVNALYQFEPGRDARDEAYAFKEAVDSTVLLLSPFAPHIASELWESMGNAGTPESAGWPGFEPSLIESDELLIVVQVNGKLRDRFTVPADSSEDDVKSEALKLEKVRQFVADKTPKMIIYVKGKLVNIVV